MKKYETYKESGVDWIGKIPKNWRVSQYKFVAEVQNGFAFKSNLFDKSEGFPILRIRDITSGNISTYYKGDYSEDYIVKKGDLLIGMDGDFNVRWWDKENVLLNQRCCRIINMDNSNKRFLYYSLPFNLQIINDLTYFTTVKHLSSGNISDAKFALPTLKEQTQIANYLDHKTQIIDTLIAKKEQLLKKLQAQRQAIINEAVTKGLNKNAKMKASGSELLGAIPEHWGTMKMKNGCEFILDGTHGSYKRVDKGYRLLSVRNIINDEFTFRDDDSCVSEKDFLEISSKFKILKGDIQLAIVGATLGKSAEVKDMSEDFVTQRSVATIRTNINKLSNKYLYYFIKSNSFQSYLWLNASYSAQPGVYLGTLQNCTIPSPNIKEQNQIVYFIEKEFDLNNKIYRKLSSQIKKLKSYRQSIISEAVTGKIDVRDWQVKK